MLQGSTGYFGIGVTTTHILHINGLGRSTSSTWATTSDRRAKKNILDIEGALEKVLKLRPVEFEWSRQYRKTHPELPQKEIGFISQDVEQVIPEMVYETQEVIGKETIEDFKLLNKDPLFPLLVKAIQEQQEIIEAQKTRIETLEKESSSLQSELNEIQSLRSELSKQQEQITRLVEILEGVKVEKE